MPRIYPRLDPFTRYVVDQESGCWIWQGARSRGYGSLRPFFGETLAHRLFAKHHKGPIHPKMEVCHRCDNPPCVNPDHLFLGTKSDNQKDCEAKGRRERRGEHNPCAVLNPKQVKQIWSDPRSQQKIADDYGVHRTTITLIKLGKKWTHVTSRLSEPSHRHHVGPPRRAKSAASADR